MEPHQNASTGSVGRTFEISPGAVTIRVRDSDHGVSEALYLSDPEGNGIEIYADRPREQWPKNGSGGIEMNTARPEAVAEALEFHNAAPRIDDGGDLLVTDPAGVHLRLVFAAGPVRCMSLTNRRRGFDSRPPLLPLSCPKTARPTLPTVLR